MDKQTDSPYHCGTCGRGVTFLAYYHGGGQWFHVMGSQPIYEAPPQYDRWRIGHDIDPWPGKPVDRRSEPDGDHFLYPDSLTRETTA
jgi:hypothetical protein